MNAPQSLHPRLVFVYNADSGLFNGLSDYLHKIFSPQTYACSLCAVTYDNLGMRREWRAFIQSLPFASRFIHRDELDTEYGLRPAALPAVFTEKDGTLELWLSAEELNACGDLQALKKLVGERINPSGRRRDQVPQSRK